MDGPARTTRSSTQRDVARRVESRREEAGDAARGPDAGGRVRGARRIVAHALRTTVAAVASLLVARLFDLPEAYWASVTTMVVTQSSLGAALGVSWQRLVGTALGAIVGAVLASRAQPTVPVFAGGIFVLGLLCALVRSDRSAYRMAGVTLAIVLLVPRTTPASQIAFHRFAEVSIGIVVALALAMLWPEDDGA